MRAYLGDPQFRKDFLAEIRMHQHADVRHDGFGETGMDGKCRRCSVGCTIHTLNRLKGTDYSTTWHEVYEIELGIPMALAYMEDCIFHGIPLGTARNWTYHFSSAIAAGADLSLVVPKFMVWLMKDMERYAKEGDARLIRQVGSLYGRVARGEGVSKDEWAEPATGRAGFAAAEAARAALAVEGNFMGYAADALTDAAYAADHAARAALGADVSPSDAFEAADDAREESFTRMSRRLIRILRSTGPEWD